MKEVKRYLDSRVGCYSFCFEDLDSGYSYGMNEYETMPSASCIKVPIAAAVLKKVQDKELSLDYKVLIEKKDMVSGPGIVNEFDEKEYSIKELVNAMLVHSDNSATNKVIDLVGMEYVNESIAKMGMKHTHLERKMIDFKERQELMDNYTNAADLAHCLKILYRNEFLDKEHSDILLAALKRQGNRDKVPFYIPQKEWKNIANKTGGLHRAENDMALITVEKGNFILTILSKTLPNNVYGIVTISRVGKMMWDIIDKNWG